MIRTHTSHILRGNLHPSKTPKTPMPADYWKKSRQPHRPGALQHIQVAPGDVEKSINNMRAGKEVDEITIMIEES